MPYVTAAIEAEDPFLHHAVNGIDMYDISAAHAPAIDSADGNHRIFHEDYPNVIKSWDFPSDASQPRSYIPREAVPYLSLKFPYNLVRVHIQPGGCGSISDGLVLFGQIVYLSLPILVPTALGIVYVRILTQGRESRKRVEEIEKADSYSSKLIHAVAELEREMEDQVTEFIDTQTGPIIPEKPSKEKEEDKWWVPCSKKREGEHAFFCSCRRKNKELLSPEAAASESGSVSSGSSKALDDKKTKGSLRSLFKHDSRAPSPDPGSETSSITETDPKAEGKRKIKWRCHKKSQPKLDTPVLLEVQREMIERLNKLPGLRKERAFYDDTRNSHASIVCREDRGFNPDVVDSTLRHWADRFIF